MRLSFSRSRPASDFSAMTRHLVHRLAETLVVLAAMSLVFYALIALMPGDPIDIMVQADPKLTPADAARLKALYGLDRPILVRYGNWLQAALGGDLGYSRIHARPVLEIMLPRLGNTFVLMGLSLVLALALALPLGITAALRQHATVDNLINLGCFAGISIPPFWLALMLIIGFAVILGWLPASGMFTIGDGGLADRLQHLVLPVATLTLASVGAYIRFLRAAVIETMRLDFIRTARAKGAGEARVVLGHALRNALIPLVTIVGLSFGGLFSGALITEIMFAWPGLGKMIYDAIMGNDFNLALAGLLFATLMTLIGNLLADLGVTWLDPRIVVR
jgi:peptide/nickel transport system permease protein